MHHYYIENKRAQITELRLALENLCRRELSLKGRVYIERRISTIQDEIKRYENITSKEEIV